MEYSIKENEIIDKNYKKKNFAELTKEKLTLSLSELAQIRSKILNKYKNLDLDDLVKILKMI